MLMNFSSRLSGLQGYDDLRRVHEPKIEAILGNLLHLELVLF